MPLFGPESTKQLMKLGSASTAGMELVVATVIGFFGGRWLDTQLGTEPWLKWLGLGFGLAAGFRSLYRLARQAKRDLANDSPEDPS